MKTQKLLYLFTITLLCVLSGCEVEDPVKEDIPELITKAVLVFTPSDMGPSISVTASDPDADGVEDIAVDGPINLDADKTYTLQIELYNELADPSSPEYDITNEVEEEGDEHIFFFAWTNNIFSDPEGNGNMDNRANDMNYEDEDDNGMPIGLKTSWTTAEASSGTFQILLKHQPEVKSADSDSTSGETDLNLLFDIHVN